MAKKSKLTKTAVAAIETEANEAIHMMAIETLGDALLNEALADTLTTEEIGMITEAELDQAVQILEASDQVTSAIEVIEAPAEAVEAPQAVTVPADASSWDKALSEISQDAIDLGVMSVAQAMDDRAAYELIGGSDNIQRTLKKARAQLATKRATAAMLVAGFNEAQINRSVQGSKRYNVYALGKLADVLYGVSGGAINNAVNNAIMRSLFKMRRSAHAFTMDVAKAAVSDKIRLTNKAIENLLIRHTVSASTAPTQASSTMQALVDLGVVSRSGSEKNPIFALTDAPIVAKLEAVLQAA